MAKEIEFIRELEATHGQTVCLVRQGANYFAISSIPAAPDHGGPETLAFAADEEGTVLNLMDVAGGRGWTREQTLAELAQKGPDSDSWGRGLFGDTKPRAKRTSEEVMVSDITTLMVAVKAAFTGLSDTAPAEPTRP